MFCLIRLGLTTKCCLSKQVVGFVRETFLLFLLVTFKVKPVTPPSHPQKMNSNCFESLFFYMSRCLSIPLNIYVLLSLWISMSLCFSVPLPLSLYLCLPLYLYIFIFCLYFHSLFWFTYTLSILSLSILSVYFYFSTTAYFFPFLFLPFGFNFNPSFILLVKILEDIF